jgi:rabenosyn-5
MEVAASSPSRTVRRVFGGTSLISTPHSRQNSLSPSPSRILGNLAASTSSQSLDQLSGTEDERETTLTCPICNENMITLLQLNRHLDDVHREVEEVQKQTVKSWFQKRIKTAKRLPPVVALNKTLGKSEPFERNGEQQATGLDATVVTDEIVTRKHWQQETGNDYCSEPSCGKPLNNKNGHINCFYFPR